MMGSRRMSPSPSRLRASIDAARSVHPSLSVSVQEFESFLAQRLDTEELDETSVATHAADLLLVCAVLRGDARALEVIERTMIATLDQRLTRIVGNAAVPEVQQRLRETVLVAKPGTVAGIAAYAGRGPLRAYIRAAAVRIALKLRGDQTRTSELAFDVGGPVTDPVLGMIRDKYAGEFRTAFELALHGLERRDRIVLRQQFVDGLGTEALAELYRVHRVTMFRRLVKIRQQLLAATRKQLAHRLMLDGTELDSVMRALTSDVDVTLERVLAEKRATTRTPSTHSRRERRKR
jgi:RNA polymerase sigma-70 factor (ECF subfamily)